MSDLFEDPAPGDNAPEYSVSELSGAVKKTIESGFARVRVRGEVGRVSRPRSGHIYMDLKDDRSVLAGVVWKGQASRLATQPEEGLEVIATGRLTTFPGQSKYQIVIDSIAPAGVGALMAMLEKRRKALEAEGLFGEERKKPLPYLPEVIGVVTSPSGAVIRDILHRLRDRFPRKVLIWPVAVQGERSAPEVARAITGFNAMTSGGALPRPDLLIVARGGGSVEDLWGFNEEVVVRAVAASTIPLISAVGHETDTTLIDFAADRRAPTPTAAAELAVPVRAELLAWGESQGARLTTALARGLQTRTQRLRDLSRALPRAEDLTKSSEQRLDFLADRLPRALRTGVEARRLLLANRTGILRPTTLEASLRQSSTQLETVSARLERAVLQAVERKRLALAQNATGVSPRPIRMAIHEQRRAVEMLKPRLNRGWNQRLEERKERLGALNRLRESLGHKRTLERGYAIARVRGKVVKSAQTVRSAATVELEFHDGKATLGGESKPRKKQSSSPDQGQLI